MRFNRNKIRIITACVYVVLLGARSAHAGLFDDDEARRAILDVRARADTLAEQLSAAQSAILNQANQIAQLQQQLATLRGQQETLNNQISERQRTQQDRYAELDARLLALEPEKQTVDGIEGSVQPGEAGAFETALTAFRKNDFKHAVEAFKAFTEKYPQSLYRPAALYWLGNTLYAQRNYKGATAILQSIVKQYPTHPKAPDALFAIAQNQLEQGQTQTARKTLQQLVTQYGETEAAARARNKLAQFR
jgi:tol-pal system protein YbgF